MPRKARRRRTQTPVVTRERRAEAAVRSKDGRHQRSRRRAKREPSRLLRCVLAEQQIAEAHQLVLDVEAKLDAPAAARSAPARRASPKRSRSRFSKSTPPVESARSAGRARRRERSRGRRFAPARAPSSPRGRRVGERFAIGSGAASSARACRPRAARRRA